MIHHNGEPLPLRYGGLDEHDTTLERRPDLYAQHLVKDHGYSLEDVAPYAAGATWAQINGLHHLHKEARLIVRDTTGIHNNRESKPYAFGPDEHDSRFANSAVLYAEHLVKDHGYSLEDVEKYTVMRTHGDWFALDALHRIARNMETRYKKHVYPN